MSSLARALTDPAHSSADLSSLFPWDRERVRYFAGFIAKVQHNFLWEQLPLTVAALRRRGLELDLFTSLFSLARTPRVLGLRTMDDKLRNVAAFIAAFARSRRAPGLAALVRYELLLLELKSAPRQSGGVRVERFEADPLAEASRDRHETRRPRPCWLLFFASRGRAETRVAEIDRGTALLVRHLAKDNSQAAALRVAGLARDEVVSRICRLQKAGVLAVGRAANAHRVCRQSAAGAERVPSGSGASASSRPHLSVRHRGGERA